MDSESYLYIFIVAIVGLIVGYCFEGNGLTPGERFFQIIKWISVVIVAVYALVIVAALSDGLGDILYLEVVTFGCEVTGDVDSAYHAKPPDECIEIYNGRSQFHILARGR
jgi:hypothetical protein